MREKGDQVGFQAGVSKISMKITSSLLTREPAELDDVFADPSQALRQPHPLFFLTSIFFLSIFLINTAVAQETFQYSGHLESDSVRKAQMGLSISGTNVTGNLRLEAVCQSNARLPGAEFKFDGTLSGTWEGKGSISGTWTGTVIWCDKSEPRSGEMTITGTQGGVYFSGSGSYYNRYVFSPTGKVYNPSEAAGAPSSWRPTVTVRNSDGKQGIREDHASAPSYGSLGRPREGFQSGIVPNMRGSLLGTVEMSLNETRMFSIPLGGATWYWGRSSDGKRIVSATDCYAAAYYVEGAALKDLGIVGDGTNVKAVGEGIGRVYGRKSGCKCEYEGGEQGRCPISAVWLVVVGEKGYMEYTGKKRPAASDEAGPAPDIKRASVSGRTVMRGSKTPVDNAQISLVSSQGGSYSRDNWKSGSNGGFNITADNMLISGVHEVMAFKKSADMGTREDPITVDKDLWPIKRYLVRISKQNTRQGTIDVGDIEMDTVDNIFNKGAGREAVENRGTVKKDAPPTTQGKDTGPSQAGYNPLSDPGLKDKGSVKPDFAGVDKLGGEFQDGIGKSNKSDQASQQTPISQPETYTGSGKKKDDDANEPTHPPGYPPYDYPPDDFIGTGGYYPGDPNWGKGGKHGGGSHKPVCDSSQRSSAYDAGYKCGKKAAKQHGKMSSDCLSAFNTYKNIDKKTGWGSCLAGGFDDGYRSGLSLTAEAAGGSGSGSGTGSSSGSIQNITAELRNKAGENVHIFVEGQDNFGPHNRLTPGGSRTVKVNAPQGGIIKFVAGRNGQVLSHCGYPTSSGASALVTFSGSNTLTCAPK